MHVKNTTGQDLYVSAVGDFVKNGETAEVDDDDGARLVAQGWTVDPDGNTRRAELATAAAELGVDVRRTWSADRIQKAIDDHQAALEAPPADTDPTTTEADPADPQED